MKTYEVIVLGVGTMGAAACYHLAQRGASVLGLEQHAIPHTHGAHHGQSRVIRLAYYEHPDYVPLLKRAYTLWDELSEVCGQQVIHRTGGLYMGRKGQPFLEGALASAREHGLAHEHLDADQIRQRYPMFQVPDTHEAIFEEPAGFVVPDAVMAAHVTQALEHGAHLHGHTRVTGWETTPSGGVTVRTEKETYQAQNLLITAGAWTGEVLAELGLKLTVTRQTWGWFWPPDPTPFQYDAFPCWFYECPDGGGHYGFPMMPSDPGFKLAQHLPSSISGGPDRISREITAEDEALLREFLQEIIPGAHGDLLAIRTCLYTNSPDGHFIIDRHPKSERVHFACGFSGHGFKFASVMGEVLADLALQQQTAHPIEFLSTKRFG